MSGDLEISRRGLLKDGRLMLVQIGKYFFTLRFNRKLSETNTTKELKALIENKKYSLDLLKEEETY